MPDRVTARQFKLQLFNAGLLDQVEECVNGQPRDIQITYANSSTFARDEPMMQTGFAALAFSPGQIDTFFAAASAL